MKASDMLGRLLAQITSGRWIVTIAAILCFVMLTKTLCALMIAGKIVLETATYVAIVMSILNIIGTISMFYFNKNRPTNNGNGNGDEPTPTPPPAQH